VTMSDQRKRRIDIEDLRRRARRDIDEGAVTEDYPANREEVVGLLNEALATELVCALRYRRHHFMARGLSSKGVADEFMEHAREEQDHADWIAARIVQLNGEPDFDPATLAARSHAEYVPGLDLVDMIREDLVAERIAIESYRSIIQLVGNDDPTTRRLFERILAVEEEHAEEMSDLLTQHTDPSPGPLRRPIDDDTRSPLDLGEPGHSVG